jgi:hypothetical protein
MKLFVCAAVVTALAPLTIANDGDSIDAAVRACYAVISGPAGTRDWVRFHSLFAEGARLIPMRQTPQGSLPAAMTPEDYEKRAGATFEKNAFYESEVAHRVETFGDIAHVFSTYESRHAPEEKPFARGINSFQLVKTGAGWKIMTILWDSEREGLSLPQKYLATPQTAAN